jgi:hypothetical protein
MNIEKTLTIALTSYASYYTIRYFIPGNLTLTVTRDQLALFVTAYVCYSSFCPLSSNNK